MNNILIVTAVEAEREAILRGLPRDTTIDVIAAGVGSAASAANTAKVLAGQSCDYVICAGIGGGFRERISVGGLAIADVIVAADLGSESKDAFLSVEHTGIGISRIQTDDGLSRRLLQEVQKAQIDAVIGPIVTVNTTTGTAESAAEMVKRVPEVCAEGMEGFGAAYAASLFNVPCLELRAISNDVGPRDRDSWRINEALDVLTKVSVLIQEGLK